MFALSCGTWHISEVLTISSTVLLTHSASDIFLQRWETRINKTQSFNRWLGRLRCVGSISCKRANETPSKRFRTGRKSWEKILASNRWLLPSEMWYIYFYWCNSHLMTCQKRGRQATTRQGSVWNFFLPFAPNDNGQSTRLASWLLCAIAASTGVQCWHSYGHRYKSLSCGVCLPSHSHTYTHNGSTSNYSTSPTIPSELCTSPLNKLLTIFFFNLQTAWISRAFLRLCFFFLLTTAIIKFYVLWNNNGVISIHWW